MAVLMILVVVVQSLSCVQLFATQWTAAHQASQSFTISWRRAWQPTPEFLPGESCGQRSLEGYSLWGHKELDTTEVT